MSLLREHTNERKEKYSIKREEQTLLFYRVEKYQTPFLIEVNKWIFPSQ